MSKTWVIADIHGDYKKLLSLYKNMKKEGFSIKNGDTLVQLGDRWDRGPDSYRVNNFFFKRQKKYPKQFILIQGNHEDMGINAAHAPHELPLFTGNGGNSTIKSYADKTKQFGKNNWYYSLVASGHYDWIKSQPYYYETDDYFFSHAPIPDNSIRNILAKDDNFRNHKKTLIWSYEHEYTQYWVDHFLDGNKLYIHGHIHGLKYNTKTNEIISPGVRRHGNSILLDTGSGCHPNGPLSCLILPDLKVIDSDGKKYEPNRIDGTSDYSEDEVE
jgi:predicted phosphodiesterase